ncbi:hypothetical protein SAMN04487783_1970 [Agrococcus baldri]|uniref:Uncharacterized protein n=1 Tax=Agrococcus baldri TaxID=153730 RepID=A0AA94L037_9MICO|nr:hypothetical protein [Agrococcus baldri]SFS15107.1 hypothetical protein SAMN04487783_1970 [Agrococcus baldri]
MDEPTSDDDQLLAEFRNTPTPRSGQPWAEEDFAAIMQACRSGATIEQIARRIGRTPTSLPMQIRRMLPLEERQLTAELALPRLRQLDEHGDYDWLAAMAQREQTAWERSQETRAEQRSRGIEALSDEHVLAIALVCVTSTVELPVDLRRELACALAQRGIEDQLASLAADAASDAVAQLSTARSRDFDWVPDGWAAAR